MAYQTFALKYRPRDFDEIIAQDHVAVTLKNAVAEGRVAHGYLFAGPRGTGKTSTARVLAKALNCAQGPTPEPCGVCPMCTAIAASRALDVIERDAASERGINEMKALLEKVPFSPAEGRCKVYILDEAHMLTPEASNALLKTLEEPPEHCYFILATTEPHKILPTIKSRCQIFEFRPIPLRRIMDSLAAIAEREGIKADDAALAAIAQAAGGSMRDAQSIFDQVVAYQPGEIRLEAVNRVLGVTEAAMLRRITEAIADADIEACFAAVDSVVSGGKDIAQLIEDLALYARDLLRLSLGAQPPTWSQTPDTEREGMAELARRLGAPTLTAMIRQLGEASGELKESSQHALLLELTLAELATMIAEPAARPCAEVRPQAVAPGATDTSGGEPPASAAPQAPPAPAGGPGAIAAGTELTLALAREHWGAVTQALREIEHVSVVPLILDAVPTALEGDTLTLTFPADKQFHRDQADQRYRLSIAEAVERAFGRRLELVMRLAEAETPSATAATTPPPATAAPSGQGAIVPTSEQQEQIVQTALEVFPGSAEVTDQ